MTALCAVSFRDWIPSVSRDGVNGYGKNAKYVPTAQLKTYWSGGNLREIINTINPPISVPFETITEEYPKVFSTLATMSRPEFISQFIALNINDNRLPLRDYEMPKAWNHELDDFLQEQWPFCPWDFTGRGSYQAHLPPQQILPIKYEEPFAMNQLNSTEAQIRVVNIDAEHYGSVPQKVVFKIYKGPTTKQLYKREADVYTRLRGFPDTAITQCYGSLGYPDTDVWIIILEHACGGSLVDFFERPPPVDPEDYKLLWKRLLLLFDGLHLLHDLDKPNPEPGLTGIHQDIQPANILVFPGEEISHGGNSIYDVNFKLADFGLTEVVRSGGGESATFRTTTEGNRMYSAPEAYSNDTITSQIRPRLNSVADVWSLGAVFSDFLVWSIGGNYYRDQYLEKRKDAITKLTHINERGFEACFHNGTNRLPEVDSFHEEILKLKREEDFFSPCMSQCILEFMMIKPQARLLPMQTKLHVEIAIENAQRSPELKRPRTPEDVPPTTSSNRAPEIGLLDRWSIHSGLRSINTFGGKIKVGVMEVYDEIKNKKSITSMFKRGQPSEAGMDLPDMQAARNKVNVRNGRDQIFVIDNYHSMMQYKHLVSKVARVISYTVKVSDKNGMDLYFASNSCKRQKCKNSSDVETKVRNQLSFIGCCDMKKCLEDVMEEVKEQGMQPTSIYIFTDGIWDPDHDPEVDGVIFEAIERLVENGRKPKDLMFQFIRFGHDEEGLRRLKYLDDGCKKKHKNVEYDIVDTKPWDEHVPKIIIGSLSHHIDDD